MKQIKQAIIRLIVSIIDRIAENIKHSDVENELYEFECNIDPDIVNKSPWAKALEELTIDDFMIIDENGIYTDIHGNIVTPQGFKIPTEDEKINELIEWERKKLESKNNFPRYLDTEGNFYSEEEWRFKQMKGFINEGKTE